MTKKKITTAVCTIGTLGMLAGCDSNPFSGQGISHDYADYVPSAAKSVATGTGMVTFRASENGKVYILDWNKSNEQAKGKYAPHLIRSAYLLKGQGISVDAEKQTITVGAINNTTPTVFRDADLKTENSYEIRFDTTEHWF